MVAVRARPLAVAIVLLVRESSSIERSVVMCDTTERCVRYHGIGDTNAVYSCTCSVTRIAVAWMDVACASWWRVKRRPENKL